MIEKAIVFLVNFQLGETGDIAHSTLVSHAAKREIKRGTVSFGICAKVLVFMGSFLRTKSKTAVLTNSQI